jgi:RNA-directed DNA polymerase
VREIRMLRAMAGAGNGATVDPTRARRGKPRTQPRDRPAGLPRQLSTLPFRPRRIVDRAGRVRTGSSPAVSRQSMTAMRQSMRRWHLPLQSALSLDDLARLVAPRVRGWIAYYCRFRGSEFQPGADHLDRIIARWAMRKYKRLRGRKVRASAWLDRVRRDRPSLFVHWCGRGSFSVGAMGAR